VFGIGGSEILVILVVALLFLGPDKLPDAAKTISKGIRDLKKQSRVLQNQIESDEQIGGAIRDLKSALRGDDIPVRPPVRREPPPPAAEPPAIEPAAALTLPDAAGEPDDPDSGDVKDQTSHEELASLIKPAEGSVAKRDG
jgi:sec-independent protein translocase protein TatB